MAPDSSRPSIQQTERAKQNPDEIVSTSYSRIRPLLRAVLAVLLAAVEHVLYKYLVRVTLAD